MLTVRGAVAAAEFFVGAFGATGPVADSIAPRDSRSPVDMPSVPPPSRLAAPSPPAAERSAPLAQAAHTAATTAVLASTVSFVVHAFGIPHAMHTGKAVGPGALYLAMTVGWALVRRRRMTGLSRWALAVMVGGGLANIAEALLTGGVTDFVPLRLGAATITFSAGDVAVLAANAASVVALIQRRTAAATG